METTHNPWLEQLQLLLRTCPDRVERALTKLWEADPDLHRDLAVGAVDHGRISPEDGAACLGVEAGELERLLDEYRRNQRESTGVVEKRGGTAFISGTQVAVWEVVRAYRRFGNLDLVLEGFPILSPAAVQAALRYAESHHEEVETAIAGYEQRVARRRNEYPFAS